MARPLRSRLHRAWVGSPLASLVWFQPKTQRSLSRLYLPNAGLHRSSDLETAGGANAWFWRVSANQRSSLIRLLVATSFVLCVGLYVLGWAFYWLLEFLIAFVGSDLVGQWLFEASLLLDLYSHFELFCCLLCLISLVFCIIAALGYEFYDLVVAVGFVSALLRVFWIASGLALLWGGSRCLPASSRSPRAFTPFPEYTSVWDVTVRGEEGPAKLPTVRAPHPRIHPGEVSVTVPSLFGPSPLSALLYFFRAHQLTRRPASSTALSLQREAAALEACPLSNFLSMPALVGATYERVLSQSRLLALEGLNHNWRLYLSLGEGNATLSRCLQATWLRCQVQEGPQSQAWAQLTGLGRTSLVPVGRTLVARLPGKSRSHVESAVQPLLAPTFPTQFAPAIARGCWHPSQAVLLVDAVRGVAPLRGGVLR